LQNERTIHEPLFISTVDIVAEIEFSFKIIDINLLCMKFNLHSTVEKKLMKFSSFGSARTLVEFFPTLI